MDNRQNCSRRSTYRTFARSHDVTSYLRPFKRDRRLLSATRYSVRFVRLKTVVNPRGKRWRAIIKPAVSRIPRKNAAPLLEIASSLHLLSSALECPPLFAGRGFTDSQNSKMKCLVSDTEDFDTLFLNTASQLLFFFVAVFLMLRSLELTNRR